MSVDVGEQPEIVAARALLDDAMAQCRELAVEGLRGGDVVEAVSLALQHVYSALASLDDAQGFREARAQAVEELRGVLGQLQEPAVDDEALDALMAQVARAMQLVLVAPMPVMRPGPWLPRASQERPAVPATLGVPRVLDPTRDVLRPMIPVPEREPKPREAPPEEPTVVPDLDALAAKTRALLVALDAPEDDDRATEVPPAPKEPPAPFDPERAAERAFGERLTAMDLLFERARGCLEDLGAFGLARRPMGFESWWCPRTEARLLTRLDALAACGDAVVPWLVRLLEERPVPDPELTWATVLFFACLAGDDAIDQSMRVARVTPVDEPELRDALADAFTHAPHPAVVMHLTPWLSDAQSGRRAVALTALGRRQALSADTLAAHLDDDDPAVVCAALDALAVSPDAVPESLLAKRLSHEHPAVLRAALDALATRGSGLAAQWSVTRVLGGDPDAGDAAMHVAIGCGRDGLAVLHGDGPLTAGRCEALGWYGHRASVGVLFAALEGDDKAAQVAAAESLWRITGAALADDDPDPDLPFEGEPFGDAVWTDDELPERPESLSIDASLWRAWWARFEARADGAHRWRFGRRWRVGDGVRVLAAKTSRPRDRRWAAMELVCRTGRRLPFDAWRFLTQQSAQIEAWRASVPPRDDDPWAVVEGLR